MGKKELRKKMRTLDERIREHAAKILVERELDQPKKAGSATGKPRFGRFVVGSIGRANV